MFIPFLAASAVGIALIKLGAMAVQMSYLSLALKAAMVAIAVLLVLLAAVFRQRRFKAS